MQTQICILGAEPHLFTVADSTAKGVAEMATELGQTQQEMPPDVRQELPPSPCPAHSDHPGPCSEGKHLRRGRTFLFTLAQATPGQGRKGVRATACVAELPTNRGAGAPDQESLDEHILKNRDWLYSHWRHSGAQKKRERKNPNKAKTTKPHTQTEKPPTQAAKLPRGHFTELSVFPRFLLLSRKLNTVWQVLARCPTTNTLTRNGGGNEDLFKLICANVIVTILLKRITRVIFLVLLTPAVTGADIKQAEIPARSSF